MTNDAAEVFMPATYIADAMLERDWLPYDLAERTGMHPSVIREVLENGRPIIPVIADGLARAFGTSPDMWLNLQRAYDERGER